MRGMDDKSPSVTLFRASLLISSLSICAEGGIEASAFERRIIMFHVHSNDRICEHRSILKRP